MTSPRSGKTSLLRDINLNIILNMIARKGPLSRVDLVRESGLPKATVSRITSEFIEAGLILERNSEEASGRRPPLLLQINPTASYVLGVNLTYDAVLVVLCDLQGSILSHNMHSLNGQRAVEQSISVIIKAIKRCLGECQIAPTNILGVGVTLRGRVDAEHGICHNAADFPWHDVRLASLLEAELHVPVRIDNTINTQAMAELQFGTAQTIPHFLFLVVGQDVGLSVILNGTLYRGHRGYAGNFAHYIVDYSPQAPLCHCGQHGCLEAIVGDAALLHLAPEHTYTPTEIEHEKRALIARALSGDEQAQQTLTYTGTMLGIAITNLINMFDPDRIFVIGQIGQSPTVIQAVQASLQRIVFDQAISPDILSFIEGKTMQAEQGAHNATSLILHELFQPPLYERDQQTIIVIENLLASLKRKKGRCSYPEFVE